MRSGERGFSLMELTVVLALVGILAAIAVPVATRAIHNAKESALKEDLMILRKALDDYYADHARYPRQLKQLVETRYLRRIPVDPLTGRDDSWQVVGDDDGDGIADVRSAAPGEASDGRAYHDW